MKYIKAAFAFHIEYNAREDIRNCDGKIIPPKFTHYNWMGCDNAIHVTHSSPYNRPRKLYSFFNLGARWGVGVQRHAPTASPPGMTRYALNGRLGGPQSRSGRMRKTSPPLGFYPPTAQPVRSHYTDWTIPAHVTHRKSDFYQGTALPQCS